MCHKKTTTYACGHEREDIVRCGSKSQYTTIIPKRCLPKFDATGVLMHINGICRVCRDKEVEERRGAKQPKNDGSVVEGEREDDRSFSEGKRRENEIAVEETSNEPAGGPVCGNSGEAPISQVTGAATTEDRHGLVPVVPAEEDYDADDDWDFCSEYEPNTDSDDEEECGEEWEIIEW